MKSLLYISLLSLSLIGWSQREKPNIINYFASSNSIVGVPMVDMDNHFRFYPDVIFQEAIANVELYYFVQNDVYKSVLTQKDEGRYWEAILRDFQLGESIQRVEVVVECTEQELDKILAKYGIPDIEENDKTKYLLIRRGDDRALSLLGNRLMITQKLYSSVNNINVKIEDLKSAIRRLEIRNENTFKSSIDSLGMLSSKLNELDSQTTILEGTQGLIKSFQDSLLTIYDDLLDSTYSFNRNVTAKMERQKLLTDRLNSLPDSVFTFNVDSLQTELMKVSSADTASSNTLARIVEVLQTHQRHLRSGENIAATIFEKIEKHRTYNEELRDLRNIVENYYSSLTKVSQYDSIKIVAADFESIGGKLLKDFSSAIDQTISQDQQNVLPPVPQNQDSRLYFAYVENRRSSMLDLKFKEGKVQYTYRNDKESLQYLQADDPQERLGIFRARLIPFAFYDEPNVQDDFRWQRGKVIYEIGMNFGYTIVKGDHFKPKFFDMNRMGIAVGITADTFSDNPTFVSAAFSYDINTYSSISFGANLIENPRPYIGIGINARAFRDLVANSSRLFGQ